MASIKDLLPSITDPQFQFKPREMVRWLDPGVLIDAGIKTVVSGLFGSYADKREMQAALDDGKPGQIAEPYYNYSTHTTMWVDFVADMGDGVDSTYSIAKLLAAPMLSFDANGKQTDGKSGTPPHPTERGRLLILGGDQVYPTASREEYNDRFVGPYQAALPFVETDHPHLFAVPGNHDWYDGLTAFTRLFLQGRWIGGWETQQSRSYFAIRLPNDWWIWGIDIQLGADIDAPQWDYFDKVAKTTEFKDKGKVILCTAEPAWVFKAKEEAEDEGKVSHAYDNILYLEKSIINANGGKIAITLTGDLHHYCRYEDSNGNRQKITAGGGGAFLLGPHHMLQTINLSEGHPKPKGDIPIELSRKTIYPDEKTSKKLTWRALWSPLTNFKFTTLVGGLYLLYAWILQSASMGAGEKSFLHQLIAAPNLKEALGLFLEATLYSPPSVVLLGLIVVGLTLFCDRKKWRWIGTLHGIAHVFLNMFLICLFAHLNSCFGVEPGTFASAGLFMFEMFVIGGMAGALLMGLYFSLGSSFLNINTGEAFSCQSNGDYRNFLRLHLNDQGELYLYPIGIDKTCKEWRLNPDKSPGASLFVPENGHEMNTHLIEGPLKINTTT